MVVSPAQFSYLEMDPDEEKLEAQMLTSSLAQAYSIANWDPPLTPWPILEPIYNQKGANVFVPPSKPHQTSSYFIGRKGHNPQFLLNAFSIRGALNSSNIAQNFEE